MSNSTTQLVKIVMSDLTDVRSQLLEVAMKLTPEELKWFPRQDMKSALAILREIIEVEDCLCKFLEGTAALESDIRFERDDLDSTISELSRVRTNSIKLLQNYTDEELLKSRSNPGDSDFKRSLPAPWTILASEKFIALQVWNAMVRHEYYHVGQLISYRWILGHNPYKE